MLKCGKSFLRYVPQAFRCLVKALWIYFEDATGNKSGGGRLRLAVHHRNYFILVFITPAGVLTYYPSDLSSRLWIKSYAIIFRINESIISLLLIELLTLLINL